MLGELIIYYLKKKESSCKLLNTSFLVLKIQLSLLQCMARDEAAHCQKLYKLPTNEINNTKKKDISHMQAGSFSGYLDVSSFHMIINILRKI